MKDSGFDMEIE